MEVTVKGLKVYYTVEGCGAEDVLILEGWGTNTQVYRPISAQLSQKYHVFTPDLPGFGKSEEPKENWTVGDYAAFVKEFAGKVGIQKVTLIGHSFGGRIILKLHENPSELPFETERIVLIDSAGIRPADTLPEALAEAEIQGRPTLFGGLPERQGGSIPPAAQLRRLQSGLSPYAGGS